MQEKKDSRQAFFTASSGEYDLNSKLYKPAAAFEALHGISGVAQYYRFPDGMGASEYEIYLYFCLFPQVSRNLKDPRKNDCRIVMEDETDPAVLKELKEQWSSLQELNPELFEINLEDCDPGILAYVLCDCLRGCACLCNSDDINCFVRSRIETGGRMDIKSILLQDGDYSKLYREISLLLGSSISWVPSKQTMLTIKDKITSKAPLQQVYSVPGLP